MRCGTLCSAGSKTSEAFVHPFRQVQKLLHEKGFHCYSNSMEYVLILYLFFSKESAATTLFVYTALLHKYCFNQFSYINVIILQFSYNKGSPPFWSCSISPIHECVNIPVLRRSFLCFFLLLEWFELPVMASFSEAGNV